MNKAELVTAISDRAGLSKKDTEKFLKGFEEAITEDLANGGKIQLVGFMTLEVAERAAREGRNPSNGETIKIPASKTVKFKVGKALKDAVNQ